MADSLCKRQAPKLKAIDGREAVFIILSGIATGASWLCYYYAIQNGTVSAVICIDKMSLLITVAFSYLVFKEKPSRRAAVGAGSDDMRHAAYGRICMTADGRAADAVFSL